MSYLKQIETFSFQPTKSIGSSYAAAVDLVEKFQLFAELLTPLKLALETRRSSVCQGWITDYNGLVLPRDRYGFFSSVALCLEPIIVKPVRSLYDLKTRGKIRLSREDGNVVANYNAFLHTKKRNTHPFTCLMMDIQWNIVSIHEIEKGTSIVLPHGSTRYCGIFQEYTWT